MRVEHWKDVPRYEGRYSVSNFGRVRSVRRVVHFRYHGIKKHRVVPSRILKPALDHHGYLTVSLYKNGRDKNKMIHRLVAEAFISNPHHYVDVNHKDECRTNNRASNLEWCNSYYNYHYGDCVLKKHLSEISHDVKRSYHNLMDEHDKQLVHQIILLIARLHCLTHK